LIPLYDINPHRRFPWLTLLVIVINVGILASQGRNPPLATVYEFGLIPKRLTATGSGKPVLVRVPVVNARGEPIPGQARIEPLSTDPVYVYPTFLTMMFLHGNWFHLAMNMWMLWIFGNNIEDRLGRLMYVCYYLLGGMVGSLCQWAIDPMSDLPVIGASGAVATVLGGYAITFPKVAVKTLLFVGIPLFVNLPALVVLGVWFLIQLLFGFALMSEHGGQPVAYWAHIGGFAAGVVLLPFLSLGAAPAEADWKREAKELFEFHDPRSPNPDR
jgi:membrane associated rhomboid family serine protease